jgi:hypothetical protein
MGCGADVEWRNKRWRNPGTVKAAHRCADNRPTCGAWMPYARERCARGPNHTTEHRTRYSLDNARSRVA